MGSAMHQSGSFIIVVMLIVLIPNASLVESEGSILFKLNSERNMDMVILDLVRARTEQLSSPKNVISGNSTLINIDIENDGYPEILYCSSEGEIIKYSAKGDSFSILTEGLVGVFTHTPQVLDLDKDGSLEILAYDSDSMSIRCFDLGSMDEEWTIKNEDETSRMSPQPKIIIGQEATDTRVLLIMGPGTFVIFDGLGEELWRWKIENVDQSASCLPSIGVADIDWDGDLEAVVTSQKGIALRSRYIGVDIFSIERPTWVSKYIAYRDLWQMEGTFSPPLLVDIDPAKKGLEIIVASEYNGIMAISPDDETELWQWDPEENEVWQSLGTVGNDEGLMIFAYSKSGILVMNSTSGQQIHRSSTQASTLTDHPLVGYFEPSNFQQGLLLVSDRSVTALDPWDGRQIWTKEFDEGISISKHILITGRTGVTSELHIFSWNESTGKGSHLRYWSPESGDHHISVTPENMLIRNGVDMGPAKVTISGPTDDVGWVVMRMYQGHSDDILASSWIRLGGGDSRYHFTNYPTVGFDRIRQKMEENQIVQTFYLIVAPYSRVYGDIHLQVMVCLKDGTSRSLDVERWLRWPVDLYLEGNMLLTDEKGRDVPEGGWVRGGSGGKLHGLTLVFNETGKPPSLDLVNISLRLEGFPGEVTLNSDGEITSRITFPLTTSLYRIYLEITASWPMMTYVSNMTIRVDAKAPEFIEFHPSNGTWLASTQVVVGCSIIDGHESGLGAVQVQMWPDGESPGDWVQVNDIVAAGDGGEAIHVLSLGQGTWHFRWRAYDAVSNGPTMSPELTLHVDLSYVSFSEFHPTGWVNVEEVNVSILLRDVGGSGVDLKSIEYAFTTNGLHDFTPWMYAGLSGTSTETQVTRVLDMVSGRGNYVMFRASDVAGNTRTSNAFHVRVDTEGPVFQDPVPKSEDVTFNSSVIRCSVHIKDYVSGVDPGSVGYQYAIGNGFSEWASATYDANNGDLWAVDVPRNPGGPTAVRWRATDLATSGMTISEIYTITLNLPPIIVSLEPVAPLRTQEDQHVSFRVVFNDPEADEISIAWSVDGEVVAHDDTYVCRLSPGEHDITLSLNDGQGNIVEEKIEVLSDELPEFLMVIPGPWILILLVVTSIAIAVIYVK